MTNLRDYVEAIKNSDLTIYDHIEIADPALWLPMQAIEDLLNHAIVGESLAGLPLKTRSKIVKRLVCHALGYEAPSSFRKTQPRFPGQLLDVYVQKSMNLQIWNEDISPTRRYAIVRVSEDDSIIQVKVVTGDALARLDKTGTLTRKHQARITPGGSALELVTRSDTDRLRLAASEIVDPRRYVGVSASGYPRAGELLTIAGIFRSLSALVGRCFPDAGYDQERNRGAALHKLVCHELGYGHCQDDGRFPDLRHQLLEVKLQTAATIDLGLVCPDSEDVLDMPRIAGKRIRQCDVRYAVFYAITDGSEVTLTHLVMTTGESFFTRFPRMRGRTINRKLQIPLPTEFFRS